GLFVCRFAPQSLFFQPDRQRVFGVPSCCGQAPRSQKARFDFEGRAETRECCFARNTFSLLPGAQQRRIHPDLLSDATSGPPSSRLENRSEPLGENPSLVSDVFFICRETDGRRSRAAGILGAKAHIAEGSRRRGEIFSHLRVGVCELRSGVSETTVTDEVG